MSWELPDRISVREVGPRDGLQNEDPVPTDAKVALLDALSATGVQRIEAVSFVRPSAIPQMADADEVWKRAARAPSVRYSANLELGTVELLQSLPVGTLVTVTTRGRAGWPRPVIYHGGRHEAERTQSVEGQDRRGSQG